MSQMDVDHRRDSKTERLCRDAVRALDAVLANDERWKPEGKDAILRARGMLQDTADHIVAVWD